MNLSNINKEYIPYITVLINKIERKLISKSSYSALVHSRSYKVYYTPNSLRVRVERGGCILIYIDMTVGFTVGETVLDSLIDIYPKVYTNKKLVVTPDVDFRSNGFIKEYPMLMVDIVNNYVYTYSSIGKKLRADRDNWDIFDTKTILERVPCYPRYLAIDKEDEQ